MIRNEQSIAIIFNKLADRENVGAVYKAFDTQRGEFINIISTTDTDFEGKIVGLGTRHTTTEAKTPTYSPKDVFELSDFSEKEQDYIGDIAETHQRKMQYLDDVYGVNGRWGRMRARFASAEVKDFATKQLRARPQ